MDGFSGTVVQTYKMEKKNSKKEKQKQQPETESPSRKNDNTIGAIGRSTRDDVCSCIRVLTEYIKEALKLVFCTSSNPKQCDHKFGPLFCEMGDITLRLLYDMFNLLKYLLKSIIILVCSDKPPWQKQKPNEEE